MAMMSEDWPKSKVAQREVGEALALLRIRRALGLMPHATLGDIAFHVECAVKDVARLHAEKMALKYPPEAKTEDME